MCLQQQQCGAVLRASQRQNRSKGRTILAGGVRGDGGIRPIDGLRRAKSAVGGLGGWFRKDFPVGGSEAVLLHLRAPATMGRGCSRLQRPFLDQQSPISELLATVRSASFDNRRQAGLLRLFASWPNRKIESGCPPYCSTIPDLSAKDRELQQRREAGEARQNQVPRRYRVMSELSIRNDRFTSARLIVVLPSHQYGSGVDDDPLGDERVYTCGFLGGTLGGYSPRFRADLPEPVAVDTGDGECSPDKDLARWLELKEGISSLSAMVK